MLDGMKTYKIKNLASVQTGPFGSQLHQRDYIKNGIPILTVEHLGENKILHNDLPCISEQDRERLKKYTLLEGDIVFSRVGSVDRRAFVSKEEEGWLFSGRCLRIRPNTEIVNGKFLSYYFGLETFKKYIRGIAVGATMPSLNTSILNEIVLQIPPLDEQAWIASILSSLDDKIELDLQMNKTLEAIAQSIFKEWFIDFRFPGFDGDVINGLPKGWKKGNLSEIARIEIGRTPPRNQSKWFSKNKEDIKWLSIKDMGTSGAYITDTSECLTSEAKDRFRIPEIRENTLVLSFKLTVGRTAITTEKMLSNEAIAQIISAFGVEFLYCYLSTYNFDTLGSTSSIATAFNSKSIREMPIIIPDQKLVNKFCEVQRPFFERMRLNSLEIKTLRAIRDNLLPRLITGKIKVQS